MIGPSKVFIVSSIGVLICYLAIAVVLVLEPHRNPTYTVTKINSSYSEEYDSNSSKDNISKDVLEFLCAQQNKDVAHNLDIDCSDTSRAPDASLSFTVEENPIEKDPMFYDIKFWLAVGFVIFLVLFIIDMIVEGV
jgi:flagellar biosynthesis protein FliP